MSSDNGQYPLRRLGDLLTLEYGETLPENERRGGYVPVYGSNGIVGYHDGAHVTGPGIVVGRKGSIGRVAWVTDDFWPIDTTYYVKRKTNHCLRWLYYLLTTRSLDRLNTATGVPGLNRDDVYALKVPVPGEKETFRIGQVLSAVDEAIERSRAVIEQTRRLKTALLQNLLTHGLPGRHADFRTVKRIGTFPATWELRRLGEMVADLRYGTSTSCATQPEGTPVLRIPNVIGGKVDTSDLKWAILSTAELERLRLDAGDVLIVRTNGNPDYVGRTAIFDRREGDWAFASYLIRVRCNGDRLLPQYLHAYLTTQAGRAELWDGIRTSAGNYNLNSETIKDVRVPTPPIDEQRAIIDLLAAADAKQDQFEGYLSQLINAKTALSQALLMGHKRVHAVTIT